MAGLEATTNRSAVSVEARRQNASVSRPRATISALVSTLCIVVLGVGLASLGYSVHYALPAPAPVPTTSTSPAFSEALATRYIDHLAGEIGYRIVGTQELTDTLDWLLKDLEVLRKAAVDAGSPKKMEIWHQQGDGAHLFEFMDKMVWKKYFSISNIVVRVSDPGIPASEDNAVLVNAHLDSTLPSPGAADDLAGVAVMAEAIRVIMNSQDWKLYNSIIFLFNAAEESLQDASHLFITKHPLKETVRAVINLEAAGTGGAEILFQATSTEMVKAYSRTPYPYGTILATEIFATGLLVSDTDFRQFEQYGNITGLDMALIENSYLYHTRQDIPSNVGPGALQHMGENTLALLQYLTSSEANIRNIERSTETVFFSALGGRAFFMYSKGTALQLYTAVAALAAAVAYQTVQPGNSAAYLAATVATPLTLIGGLASANSVAFILATILRKPMSWFRGELLPVILFTPATLLGICIVQYCTASWTCKRLGPTKGENVLSHAALLGQLSCTAVATVTAALFRMGSAYLTALNLGALSAMLLVNDLVAARQTGKAGHVHLPTYVIGMLVPFVLGMEGLLGFLDIFVPLTGRMGHEPPADHIIASLVAFMTFNIFGVVIPFVHRHGRGFLSKTIVLLLLANVALVIVFSHDSWVVFDATHPRRALVLHVENVTTTPPTFTVHVACLDRACRDGPGGFGEVVQETMNKIGIASVPVLDTINDEIPDWDVIYPVSQFLKSYKLPLPSPSMDYVSPWSQRFTVSATSSSLDHMRQQRRLTLTIDHPGIIWSVIAFDADVVSWDLPAAAQRGMIRHHVKETSAFGVDKWTLELAIRLPERAFLAAQRNDQRLKGQRSGDMEPEGQLRIDFSGLDELGLYPAKATRGGMDGRPAMAFFEVLDRHLPDYFDPMLLGAVASVAYV